MAIANKFIHFNTKAGFLNKLSEYVTYSESNNTYVVKEGKQTDWDMFKNYTCFIKETSEVWTHEQFYTSPATNNPKPLGLNSELGTSLKYAREDHVHPEQVNISGNSGTTDAVNVTRLTSHIGNPISVLKDVLKEFFTNNKGVCSCTFSVETAWTAYWNSNSTENLVGGAYWTATRLSVDPINNNYSLILFYTYANSMGIYQASLRNGTWSTIEEHRNAIAETLKTPRKITLTNGASGSTTFDGSKDVTLAVSVQNDSHQHGASTITGVYESNLKWASTSNTPTKVASTMSPIDTCMIPALSANRFAGLYRGITYEYSRDGGVTWLPYSAEDSLKITQQLFNETQIREVGKSLSVGNTPVAGELTTETAWQSRITIDSNIALIYTGLSKFAIYISTNYSNNCTVSIVGALGASPEVYDHIFAEDVRITGWSGWNTINTQSFIFGNTNTRPEYIRNLRFIFKFNGISDPTKNSVLKVISLMAFGGVGWNAETPMAKYGTLYYSDPATDTLVFEKYNLKATKFITEGGTDNQVILGSGETTSEPNLKRLTLSSGYDSKLILNNTDSETNVSYISFQQNGTEVTNLGINSVGSTDISINGYRVWHDGNDGSGSNLDADKLDGKHLSEITLPFSRITGTISESQLPEIPISKIPAAALERLFVVATEAAAMNITVQEGDVVQVTGNNNKMYFCISDTATTFANKFKEFTAGSASNVPWSGITNKPNWITDNIPTGVNDTYSNNNQNIPVNMFGSQRQIEGGDSITIFTTDGEIEKGPMFDEDSNTYLNGAGEFAALPSASTTRSGVINTSAQTFAGTKTFNGKINLGTDTSSIYSPTGNHNSWAACTDPSKSLLGAVHTEQIGICSLVGVQTNNSTNPKYFSIGSFNDKLLIMGSSSINDDGRNYIDGGVALSIDQDTLSDYNDSKWKFYGFSGYHTGLKWSIDQDGYFSGTSNYTKNYSLTHQTVNSLTTIVAGNSYYVPSEKPFTITTLSGFSARTPDAQIISGAKIAFTASNAIKIQGLEDISGNYFIYNLTYMPNGKVAISGAGFTN